MRPSVLDLSGRSAYLHLLGAQVASTCIASESAGSGRRATYRSVVADDVSQLAGGLKLEKLLVAATASGAPYALALSALLPERVMGSLLLSPLSSAGARASAPLFLGALRVMCSTQDITPS